MVLARAITRVATLQECSKHNGDLALIYASQTFKPSTWSPFRLIPAEPLAH